MSIAKRYFLDLFSSKGMGDDLDYLLSRVDRCIFKEDNHGLDST